MCFISGGNCCTSSEIAGRTLNVNQSYCTPWCTLIQSFVNALLRLSSEMDRKSEMKWMPLSNSTVSVPKIAQHCCPFSIMRLHEHARLGGFFFCNIKAKSRKLLSRIKKPRTAISLPNERQWNWGWEERRCITLQTARIPKDRSTPRCFPKRIDLVLLRNVQVFSVSHLDAVMATT